METVLIPFSTEKRRIRRALLDLINITKPKKTFCLCGINGGISKFFPNEVEIVIAERDRKIYQKISKRYSRFRCYNDLASVVLKSEKNFEFVWLDFCGPFTDEVKQSIENLDMVDNSFMGLTLMRSRYSGEINPEVFLKKLGYEIVDRVLYQSSSPMVFFLCLKHRQMNVNGKKGEEVEISRSQ